MDTKNTKGEYYRHWEDVTPSSKWLVKGFTKPNTIRLTLLNHEYSSSQQTGKQR